MSVQVQLIASVAVAIVIMYDYLGLIDIQSMLSRQ
jgi:hypothetical protein